ncbi:sigma-70 family RNA polymerase sigma factor [Fimbriimonas ginsengisoli]|uniref:RNA polymerase ECF-type sigma factor n=1 Tax=Fimbriimonas ginsengisoli Gsoil 348 TaxID=661478 RepID=A0A068NTW6_FIMGI|nr:sigma-70 family RNA polymerase sigma factor [Fimbriimonas ginsengisoli]AIE86205.1 RNA polymerase ECF-type sigma factor [Fimbriimonas ginsengisoli Gsoil 348]
MAERDQEDQILVNRAQQGDRAAFNVLVRKHEAKAYQYAFRLTRSADEAADVVADAFVRVYNAIGNFKGQSAFSTWIYRIVTNCYLDARKKDKGRTTSLESTIITEDGEIERQIEDPSPNPHQEMELSERDERVQEAISMLPDYQRAMIVMYHSEEMSYEDISAALDLPIGTVKSRLNRARISLRDILVRHEELFRR